MRYPSPLPQGGTIDVVAPAFGATTEPYRTALANAVRTWRARGFAVREWPCVRASDGVGISSTPERCADELMRALLAPDSQAVVSCGGGELMCEVAQRLDLAALAAAPPKWFMGYSDNTNLTFPLACACETASVYGPCAPTFGMEPWHPALSDAWALLRGRDPAGLDPAAPTVRGYDAWQLVAEKDEEHPLAPYNATEPPCATGWVPAAGAAGGAAPSDGAGGAARGRTAARGAFAPVARLVARGRLLGGCLDVLANLCGTRLDQVRAFLGRHTGEGVLWFLEACDLGPLSVRRAICQLASAGWFEGAAGVLVGRPQRFGEEELGLTQREAVLGGLAEQGVLVPVVLDCDLGHLPPSMPLVCGSLAELAFRAPVAGAAGEVSVRMALV